MATSRDQNLSYSAQQINDLLICAVCLDRFKTPRLLPCQHTFCEAPCLQGLVDRFDRIRCPECRVDHHVPFHGVTHFPVNRTLQNFLDLSAQSPPVPSQQPGNNEEAGHANEGNDEYVLDANGAGDITNSLSCSSCGQATSLSQCAHCNSAVCDVCQRSHMDHIRLDINRMVSLLRRGSHRFSDAISTIESKSEQLHQRVEAGKSQITEIIERYISEMRTRQRLLNSEVQMWLLGEIRSLRMCQENVEVELASSASFCDSTESMLERSNNTIPDEDLIDIKRQCLEHMETMRSYENGTGLSLPPERHINVLFEEGTFAQSISSFGEVVINETPDNSAVGSASSSIENRSSSSRETSPAVQRPATNATSGSQRPTTNTSSVSQRPTNNTSPGSQVNNREVSNESLDRILAMIDSRPNVGPGGSPRPVPRRGERMGGLMGGGGGVPPTYGGPRGGIGLPALTGGEGANTAAAMAAQRERTAEILSRGGGNRPGQTSDSRTGQTTTAAATTPSQAAVRERVAGLVNGGAGESAGASSGTSRDPGSPQVRRPLPPNLSWELPVDFTHPRRGNVRAGDSGRNTNNTDTRRRLQERRRHNLSDTRVAGLLAGGTQGRLTSVTNTQRSQSSPARNNTRTVGQNPEPVASTSEDGSDRAPVTRTRTFTLEEFQAIREEDTQSRASTADPINRPRSPIAFNVSLNGRENSQHVESESTLVNVARNNYQDKGRAIIRFGARGSDNNQFVWPRGVAISRSDQIYIADSSNHRVQVFDSIGTYLKTFGSYGQSESEFDCLAGVAINSMGDILITDRYNHRIQIFDHHGDFKVMFGEEGQGDGQMMYPWGITGDNMGFIYVCDKENHRVQVFQSNGIFVRKFGCLGRNNGQFENPHYLAVSQENKIYVSDSSNHRIQVFSILGDYLFSFGSIGTMQGQLKYPKGIAIDGQGFVIVADSGNNRIQVFRGDGRFYCMFGSYGSDSGQFKGLEGLAVLSNGNVVVSDRENHRIQIF